MTHVNVFSWESIAPMECTVEMAIGQNLWLHGGVDEHPFATLMFTRGTGFDPPPNLLLPAS